jgi:hypothetical protein
MNEQSLQAANAFLAVAANTTQAGEFLDRPPADIGKEAGLPSPLAVARAVRALAARRRLEVEDGRYRLLDARPLDPGEPESVPRAPRKRRTRRKGAAARVDAGASADRRPTYADLGRAVIERVIDLGRESAEAVAAADHLRRDAKENKAARIEAEQRASRLFDRVKELEQKLEMAEANLRTVLAAARGRGATAGPSDTEMEALLRILKSPGETAEDGSRAGLPSEAEASEDEPADEDEDPADEGAAVE